MNINIIDTWLKKIMIEIMRTLIRQRRNLWHCTVTIRELVLLDCSSLAGLVLYEN